MNAGLARSINKELEKLRADRERLVEALRVLTNHAEEKYPHFESERGQREIATARAAIAKVEGRE